MPTLLFIHGFATGPEVWDLQKNEFSGDFLFSTNPDQISRPGKIFIIGWSLGAITALDLFLNKKEAIAGLVLVSAFPKFLRGEDYPAGIPPQWLDVLEKKLHKDFNSGIQYFHRLIFARRNIPPLFYSSHFTSKEQVFRDLAYLKTIDIRSSLGKINIPALIIHGENDLICPPDSAKYLHKNIQGAELRMFPGVGHAPFIEEPSLFNAVLKDFVKKHV
jgi:pimeloyl-[acyl-carrier protein] methyl ester esterase